MTEITRRTFLAQASCAGALSAGSPLLARAAPRSYELVAKRHTTNFFTGDGPSTPVWCYGSVPGPVLRARQGERLSVTVKNDLPDATTVHWHGLRLPNSMDGVPHLTQPPIAPGETFDYSFEVKDAGTFWYHPHVNSAEQVGRGLAGALVVEEASPPEVDRDLVWVLDDWRLQRDGNLAPFNNFRDLSHAGRLGNVATVNGLYDHPLRMRAGERIRLRLINTANARIFGLKFLGHDPWRIAVDGHPVTPARLGENPELIPPGGRLDLIIDAVGKPGDKYEIHDIAYQRSAYMLAEIFYDDESAIYKAASPEPKPLPANPVLQPDLANASFHEMDFQGGAMGGLSQADFRGETMSLSKLASLGMVWAINGRVIPPIEEGDPGEPMLRLALGQSYRLRWNNETAFDHPIHLHGHSFHLVARKGKTLNEPEILDTALVRPDENVDVAFVADNPGKWALHCHVLEHARAGMMGYVKVE